MLHLYNSYTNLFNRIKKSNVILKSPEDLGTAKCWSITSIMIKIITTLVSNTFKFITRQSITNMKSDYYLHAFIVIA